MLAMYNYLGYQYIPCEDVEEDNIKIFHECQKNGQRIRMPDAFYNHSPYKYVEFDDFVKYIQTVEVFTQG
jgi:hypothetical protein